MFITRFFAACKGFLARQETMTRSDVLRAGQGAAPEPMLRLAALGLEIQR